ncbi:RluA family pseudouridine synthase [Myxococcota bacterium]|nr:RluA family pseudouridine synthase [Myxococcota bacterium]MBU1430160.1 RluA family pseudouridine synthase [Myxococcota bacterium]MBU1900308.1 RluA family pseudouridine synthase [Myxococcota bacterium]
MPRSTFEPPPGEAGWLLEVDGFCDRWRVDRFVRHRVPRLSRSLAARLEIIDVTRPDLPLKKSQPVRTGQRLWVRRPIPDAGVRLPTPRVLYEGEGLLVLDKPPGWAAHPTASRYEGTISQLLKGWGLSAHPAHRLDVETSGVLVCGQTPQDVSALEQRFRAHEVRKVYRAVVRGQPPEVFDAHTPLGFDPQSAVRLKMGHGALPASTQLRRVAQAPQAALVEARPVSGRQHQIRAHLALAGYPIVGDKLYGEDEGAFLRSLHGALTPEDLRRLGHPRQALHAWQLRFEWGGQARCFEAPWPSDLAMLWADLSRA